MEPDQAKSGKGTEGAVLVEFLIVFLPVLTMFLCMLQLALLFSVRLLVEHAAVNSARTAAVVIGEDDRALRGSGPVEPRHTVRTARRGRGGGARYELIRRAAVLTLAPFIVDGTIRTVEVFFPRPDQPWGQAQTAPRYAAMGGTSIDKVRVRVRAEAICKIGLANRIACGGLFGFSLRTPSKMVQAEAVYPYQGASYDYQ